MPFAIRSQLLCWIEIVILICLMLFYSLSTYNRNYVWNNDLILWSDVIKKSPNKARPYNEVGMYYYERKMQDRAIPFFMKSISIYPDYAKALNNLGLCFMSKGLIEQSIVEFKKAINANPEKGMYHINLGIAYLQKGLHDLALKEIQLGRHLRKKYSPNKPSPHN